MIRKSIISLLASASLVTGGVAMVAMDAAPALGQRAKAVSKKKIKQSNRQKNSNRTNQSGGDAESGNVQCINSGALNAITEAEDGSNCTSGAVLVLGGATNLTGQGNANLNTAVQADVGSGNAVAADNG